MDFPVEKLINAAKVFRERAYAPYSNFRVGAALLSKGYRIYKGCNIENASYGLSICAERVALFNAISNGECQFVAIAIFADSKEFCSPCGACRQVLKEFGDDIEVFMVNGKGEYRVQRITDLLPEAFKLK